MKSLLTQAMVLAIAMTVFIGTANAHRSNRHQTTQCVDCQDGTCPIQPNQKEIEWEESWKSVAKIKSGTRGCSASLIEHNGQQYILTAAHCVMKRRDKVKIEFPGGETYTGRVHKIDPDQDLATVVVNEIIKLPAYQLAKEPSKETAYAFGYVGITNRPRTVIGKLSHPGVNDFYEGQRGIEGMSGGPVLNGEGEMIGVLWGRHRNGFVANGIKTILPLLDGLDATKRTSDSKSKVTGLPPAGLPVVVGENKREKEASQHPKKETGFMVQKRMRTKRIERQQKRNSNRSERKSKGFGRRSR